MYLKSLTLKGFKSFADRTHLTLEPGACVIVGPNGSGKSNISDAILWVLGEQSARALRGNVMEDVIFAGSSGRQAVGVAEVDMVLDNSDGTVPLDFSEVTITRRMYRSGESEYLLNQTPSRLMDVHDLLHDSGLGRDTHSIISQGRLEEVLNSRPEDRRSLIEEAAGVLKHKKRKERAIRKLAAMDAHLTRAKDVLAEIDRQLRPLERQAGRAVQHSKLVEELRSLEVALAVEDLRALEADWDLVVKGEKEAEADIELARYRLSEREKELGKFQALLEEKGLFVGDLGEQRRRLQSVLERLNSGLLLLEEKGKNLVERLSELRQKVHYAETRITARRTELDRLAEDRADADGRLAGFYQQLADVRREAEGARKERTAADEALAETQSTARRVRKELDDARTAIAELDRALSAFRLEEQLLAEQAEGARARRAALQSTLSARRTKLDQTDTELDRVKRDAALAGADVDKRVRVLESRRRDLTDARDRLFDARAELRGIEEIDRAFSAASPALAWALSKEREVPGLVAPLSERLSVEPEFEALVEQVLGVDLFAVVVRDSKSAAAVADMIAGHDAGDVTILPLDRMTAPARPDGERLIDHVSCDDEIRPALEAVIGDVVVADDLKKALKGTSAGRVVTRSGEMVHPSGKVTLGPASESGAGVLMRKRRANELAEEVDALTASVSEAEASVSEAETAVKAAQQDALELGQKLASLTGDHESLREEIGRLESGLTDADAEAERITTRAAEVADRTAKDRPAREAAAAAIDRMVAEIDSLEETAASQREARDALYRDETAAAERLAACQVDIAAVSEREIHLKRQIAGVAAEVAELEETLSSSVMTRTGLQGLQERIRPVHDLYTEMLERAEHWAERLRDRARFEQVDSESLRDTIRGAQDAAREAQADLDARNAAMADLRVEKGRIEIQVKTAAGHVVEDLGMPLETALTQPPIEDREAAMDRLHKLRKQIENIGPVNAVAVQEFEAVRRRRDFIAAQSEDLVAGRKLLTRIISAIDRKIRDRFLVTFEEVDRNFQEIFGVLFPGGRASLMLTDPDDPDVTGVEVQAQPPGKKLQKMSLLSGGEKALTALSLLFAVYRTRPCPFYVLDEVDAALDDSNLRRFIALVDAMRERTQFVVVTHQRRTMETADVLYGASMQSDGVTKVVSQRLDRRSGAPADDTPPDGDDAGAVG